MQPTAANQAAITLPQVDAPFRFAVLAGKTVLVCNQQDDPADIGSGVYNVAVCEQGQKLDDAGFGIPCQLFSPLPLDTAAIIAAIQSRETRATSITAEQVYDIVRRVTDITLTVSVDDSASQ